MVKYENSAKSRALLGQNHVSTYHQMTLEAYEFPFGKLDSENEWVKLAALVPWDVAEEAYAKRFVNNGHSAHPARIALGALIIKQRLKCSDEWVVRHISENLYLQFFIGMRSYTSKCPFGASTMAEFRKRFPPETIAELLAESVPTKKKDRGDSNDNHEGGSGSDYDSTEAPGEVPENSGTLLMDATCCPADAVFPQDFQLLNDTQGHL